jgi:HEAT repeat protein
MKTVRISIVLLLGMFAVPAHAQTAKSIEVEISKRVKELLTGDQIDRVSASMRLGEIGPPAIPALLDLLDRRVEGIGYLVASALGDMGAKAAAAVPHLIALLGHSDKDTRLGAAQALGEIGARPELSVPALQKATSDPEANVRVAAKAALARFRNTDVTDDLIRALETGLQNEKYRVLELFKDTPQLAKAHILAVIAAVEDPDRLISGRAVDLLGTLGPDAGPAVPALIRRLGVGDGLRKGRVIRTLGQIGPAAKDAVPRLVGFLGQTKVALDPETAAVIAKAAEVLGRGFDDSVNLSVPAAVAIDRIEPGHKAARVILAQSMRDTSLSPEPRIAAAERLALAAGDREALAVLISLAVQRDEQVRYMAGFALARLGDARAVPALIEALSFDNVYLQVDAADALGALGPRAAAAVPALRAARARNHAFKFQEAAETALRRIEAR